jgi:hypothetical protein
MDRIWSWGDGSAWIVALNAGRKRMGLKRSLSIYLTKNGSIAKKKVVSGKSHFLTGSRKESRGEEKKVFLIVLFFPVSLRLRLKASALIIGPERKSTPPSRFRNNFPPLRFGP